MEKPTIKAKKRLLLFLFCSMCGYLLLTGRLVFIELFRAENCMSWRMSSRPETG